MAAKKRTSKAKTTKTTKQTKTDSSSGNVTRIKASDTAHKPTPTERVAARTVRTLHKSDDAPSAKEVREQKAEKQKRSLGGPLKVLVAYFRGAWYELRQVRWPDRANTWKMTGALLAFCAFFIIMILLIDAGFKYLFELMIG